MNIQLELLLPIPILEEIISFSLLCVKLTFRLTCKRFLQFTTNLFFPTFTTTLCGNINGYQDGDFTHAQFNSPCFGALDASSTILYVSDMHNHVIRKIDLYTNQVTTLYGTPMKGGWKDGVASEARFYGPSGLALHESENLLYVSDSRNHVIKSVNLLNNKVDIVAGNINIYKKADGIGEEAPFQFPEGLALDSISRHLYVADRINHAIRRIVLDERRVETLCGTEEGYKDGPFKEAMFRHPYNIVWNSEVQELYVSDSWNHVIRVLSLERKTVSTLCGISKIKGRENGDASQVEFSYPTGLGLDSYAQYLYVSDNDHVIRKISLVGEKKASLFCGIRGKVGNKNGFFPTFNFPTGIVVDPHSHTLYVMDRQNHKLRAIVNKRKELDSKCNKSAQ